MKKIFTNRWVLGVGAALGLSVLVAGTAYAAASVTSGTDPSATLAGGTRFRAFNNGNQGVYVGAPNAVTGTVQSNVVWGAIPINKCVQLSYNGTNTLTAKVANIATPCSFTTPLATVNKTVTLTSLNYVEITFVKNTASTAISLSDLTLNAENLGTLAKGIGAAGQSWNVKGIDFTGSFTITGKLNITALSGGGDSNYVEIDVGYVAPSDTQGPVTSSVIVTPSPVLLNGEATVTATVSDAGKGDNTIKSADYSLNGGYDTSMTAKDGAFDEITEEVTATFTAFQLGSNEVCVYGTDSLDNVGDPTCQSFLVTYKFDGFFNPIDNSLMNSVKAGQAVPAKWRLTDANDAPIDDPASFDGLYSYEINCSTYLGDPITAVEEVASGSSGLQYNDDGYWQFNWKTPKSYANTCRAMYVLFNSGATSPVVKFQFKK